MFDVKCAAAHCDFLEEDNFTDPIVPALAIPKGVAEPAPLGTIHSSAKATDSLRNAINAGKELDISDDRIEIPALGPQDLPHCPDCGKGLLRPGVVWFNEILPPKMIEEIDDWIKNSDRIDLILVIGTGAKVYPAASYVDRAREKGARVAVINMDTQDELAGGLEEGDWFFQGDASVILPEILKDEIGDISLDGNHCLGLLS